MAKSFADHLKSVDHDDAGSRPTYPPQLFDWLASQCVRRDSTRDCGTGSGQAGVDLAERFERVIATDAGAAQIAQGHDPVADLAAQVRAVWGEPMGLRRICWRLALRAGRPSNS